MIFEIPFNEEIFRNQLQLNFDSAWEKNLKKNKKSIVFGLGFLALGVFIIIGGNGIGFVLISFAVFYLLNYFNYMSLYKKRKRNFILLVNEHINEYAHVDSPSTWEFDEVGFRYKDHKMEMILKWSVVKDFKLISENLFMYTDALKSQAYIIGKEEIGEENFNKLLEVLNRKVKKQIPLNARS